MNNTMTISSSLKRNTIKDYENKLFKMYERILKDKEKLFLDKGFKLVLFKQRYDVKSKKWINSEEDNFDSVVYDEGYKCIVTFALYKNGNNFLVNDKKVMNNYFVTDISRRNKLDNKWIVKYFVLNNDVLKDIEYYYVLTSIV